MYRHWFWESFCGWVLKNNLLNLFFQMFNPFPFFNQAGLFCFNGNLFTFTFGKSGPSKSVNHNMKCVTCFTDAFCRPLVKVVDNLLVMGLLDDSDLEHLLKLIDPVLFDPEYHPGQDPHIQTLAYTPTSTHTHTCPYLNCGCNAAWY